MERNFGEDDYSDGKHDNIDEKDDIDLEDYVDLVEADYDKLFNSDWCPLLGRMPKATTYDNYSCENLSVGIISNARKLWGIKPMRIYTPTDNRIESTDDKPKELHKYPQLRLDAAQAIARTYPKVKNEADIVDYQDERPLYSNTPLDENWKIAVEIVKKSLTVSLNALIKDYHILSILAIAVAWDVLKKVLYLKEKEDNRDIASQVRVETALLGKAKELFLEEKNKQLEQDTENVKNNLYERFADPKGVHNQGNQAGKVAAPVSESAKPSDQQESEDEVKEAKTGVISFPTPTDAKWPDVEIAFIDDNHVNIKVKKTTKNKVHLSKIGFEYRKTGRPIKLWKTLRAFALHNGTIPPKVDEKTKVIKIVLPDDVKRLRTKLCAYFEIDDNPISYIKGKWIKGSYIKAEGYKTVFHIKDESYLTK